MELPKDFVPNNNDGEVDEFCLVPASQLIEKICDPQMKTTSCPVTMDFLIRKGILTHETGTYPVWYFEQFRIEIFDPPSDLSFIRE